MFTRGAGAATTLIYSSAAAHGSRCAAVIATQAAADVHRASAAACKRDLPISYTPQSSLRVGDRAVFSLADCPQDTKKAVQRTGRRCIF